VRTPKKKRNLAISSQTLKRGGSETIIGITQEGEWYSPFLLETKGTKEAAGPRAIRGGPTL